MKNKMTMLLAAMAIGITATVVLAQDGPPRREGGRPGGPAPGGHPPVPPLIVALDVNKDGTIDADEIAKASESLKTLDKNGDGKLTPEELHPPRPEGGPGEGRGPRPRDNAN